MRINLFILIIFGLISCRKQEPRRPIDVKPSITIYEEVKEESKIINEIEDKKIAKYIQQDSTSVYFNSSRGFWYKYETKLNEKARQPKSNELVEIRYEIRDLNNQIIYAAEELGNKMLKIEKEDFIPALHEGIKLMKIRETITFAVPSYQAFGISGDKNRIGINQSIIVTVTLINIKKE